MYTPQEIIAIQKQKKEGKRIVALSGCFDLLHHGHLFLLREAKEQGDVLVVFLNSDASVKRAKGESRPIKHEHERKEMLLALRFVDHVVIFDDDTPLRLLEELQPDVYCNGSDWGVRSIEKPALDRYGGVLHIIALQEGYSTTRIIDRIIKGNKQ